MATDLVALGEDLRSQQQALDDLLATLTPTAWGRPTPAPGWRVRDQVDHLAHGEELAALAVTQPAAFAAELDRLLAAARTHGTLGGARPAAPGELRARWWAAAEALRGAVAAHPATTPIPWAAGPMSPASFLTARVMETFAHGVDVADAVGATFPTGSALRHVAHLGVATLPFAFANRGLAVPSEPVRVELHGPAGQRWCWGPERAADHVLGPAIDFCLLVTQRRHRDDLGLDVVGPVARRWVAIAQCFAGPATDGPPPGGRPPDC